MEKRIMETTRRQHEIDRITENLEKLYATNQNELVSIFNFWFQGAPDYFGSRVYSMENIEEFLCEQNIDAITLVRLQREGKFKMSDKFIHYSRTWGSLEIYTVSDLSCILQAESIAEDIVYTKQCKGLL